MTLYRSGGRGSWIVERVLLGIPVRQATGIYDPIEAKRLEDTLLKLARNGRGDLIRAFADELLTGPELVSAIERYGISFAFTVERGAGLSAAIERWLDEVSLADKTKESYRFCLGFLQRRMRAKRAHVGDLPDLLVRYAKRAKPHTFRITKAAAQSLVRWLVPTGQHSTLWAEVAGVKAPRLNRRDVQGGLAPDGARKVAEKLGRYGPMWWTLCCTGMGPREYWITPWKVTASFIEIAGTKTEGRHRVVPRVVTPVRPACALSTFKKALRAVGLELGIRKLTPYVARRTYAHWLELARIPDSRCDLYMGHGPATMRGRYREHDVLPYLSDDATAVRVVIGTDPSYLKVASA